jgi:lipopolysaccharide biosynthesis glycosyltransferase
VGREVPGSLTADDIQWDLYAQRAAVLGRTLSRGLPKPTGHTVYLCTDANYLPGTMVAIFSMLRNNPGIGQRARLRVVVADGAMSLAESVFGQIAAAYGAEIEIEAASRLVTGDHTLRTSWGSFTPGHGLSDAAYYRIFMATQLVAAGETGRALYLDSDVVVGGGIDRLLRLDLAGQPIGVRRELPLPEILAAAHKLGIPEDVYFNSGVLLIDLEHPDLADALARSMDFAIHKPELLTFVDQCALNVGFLGRTAALPPEANFFLRQDDVWAADWEPTVLHFLARPKPWDPAYPSGHARRWLHEFDLLGQIVDSADLRPVMAAIFPATGW